MDSIIQFLKEDILPEEKVETDKIQRKATSYWLSEDHKLYKRSFSGPYLLCVHPEQTESLLEEMHEGICGSHTGAFNIKYMPRTSVKGQILTNLVVEFTKPEIEELPSKGNMDEKLVGTISQYCLPMWEVHGDGASN